MKIGRVVTPDPEASPRRLTTVDDPESEQFRDYTALEWWRIRVDALLPGDIRVLSCGDTSLALITGL